MTLTEWRKAVRVLDAKGYYEGKDGIEIHKMPTRYGYEYSLRCKGYGCITVEWNLSNIKDILVD